MDSNLARNVQARALATLRAEFGAEFVITQAGGRVGDINAKLSFDFGTADVKAVEDKQRKDFETYAEWIGLAPTDYKRKFKVGINVYSITAANPNRPKFAVTASRADGKLFKFPTETVKRNFMVTA